MYNYLIYFLNCTNNLKVNSMLQFKKKIIDQYYKFLLFIYLKNILNKKIKKDRNYYNSG